MLCSKITCTDTNEAISNSGSVDGTEKRADSDGVKITSFHFPHIDTVEFPLREV